MILLPIKGRKSKYEVNPSKIIALGLNYKSHLEEFRHLKDNRDCVSLPKEPILFAKTKNVLIGPGENIILPSFLKKYGFKNLRTDYEAELAIIMGRKCKNIEPSKSLNFVLGYSCMNDISQRNIQQQDESGWFRGKSFDTFGPIGPCITLTKDLPNPQNINICCRVNGKTVQNSNTTEMIFGIKEIISFISFNFTLESGDIILTGTPSGVGPLKNGDLVEVEIEEIGILANNVIDDNY